MSEAQIKRKPHPAVSLLAWRGEINLLLVELRGNECFTALCTALSLFLLSCVLLGAILSVSGSHIHKIVHTHTHKEKKTQLHSLKYLSHAAQLKRHRLTSAQT